MRRISFGFKDFTVEAELLEDRCPETCKRVWRALPLEAEIEIWKEEIYFQIPVKMPPENPTSTTTAGDVSYWPEGPALCIFFGSSQPISPVSTFARINSGVDKLRGLSSGNHVTVRKAAR